MGGRAQPLQSPSRSLSVGVVRCRHDSDKTRECFRKFGHRAGQAERPELLNEGGAGQEELGNRGGQYGGREGEPSGLASGGPSTRKGDLDPLGAQARGSHLQPPAASHWLLHASSGVTDGRSPRWPTPIPLAGCLRTGVRVPEPGSTTSPQQSGRSPRGPSQCGRRKAKSPERGRMLEPAVETAGVDGHPRARQHAGRGGRGAAAGCGVSFRQGGEGALKPGHGGAASAGHHPGCSKQPCWPPGCACPLSKAASV